MRAGIIGVGAALMLAACGAAGGTPAEPVDPDPPSLEVPDLATGWAACVAEDQRQVADGDPTFAGVRPTPVTVYPPVEKVDVADDGDSVDYATVIKDVPFTCQYLPASGRVWIGWGAV